MIKEMDQELRDRDPFDQAIIDIEREFDVDLSEAFNAQQKSDMEKIIKHYGSSFFRDGTKEDVGNDLEQLEYSPDEVEVMVPHIMKAVEIMWGRQGKK